MLVDEDSLEEKIGVKTTSELQMQVGKRKLFTQIVYELKNPQIEFGFVESEHLSYQPLRKLGDHEWYEG